MKIISGKFKGRNFFMPQGVRATQNVTRKAVFDLLGQDMEGLSFLDLYAGSGGVGLEALSQGAKEVIFVERDRKFAQVIEDNVRLFGLDPNGFSEPAVHVFTNDAFVGIKQLTRYKKRFNIIFADPPYHVELAKKTLKSLGGCDILHPNCFLIIQHEKREILPSEHENLTRFMQRAYGGTYLSIYRNKAEI